jgi:hypothetical protein
LTYLGVQTKGGKKGCSNKNERTGGPSQGRERAGLRRDRCAEDKRRTSCTGNAEGIIITNEVRAVAAERVVCGRKGFRGNHREWFSFDIRLSCPASASRERMRQRRERDALMWLARPLEARAPIWSKMGRQRGLIPMSMRVLIGFTCSSCDDATTTTTMTALPIEENLGAGENLLFPLLLAESSVPRCAVGSNMIRYAGAV